MKNSNKRHSAIATVITVSALLGVGSLSGRDQALIIDHNCANFAAVPQEYIKKAQEQFKVSYGHTSHGSQIVSGMQALTKALPGRVDFSREGNGLSLWDNTPPGDLGNPDRESWSRRTEQLLKGKGGDRNLVVWSWCGQAGSATASDIETYLGLMSKLERDFPKVTFVYMTGHLDGSGKEGNLNQRNEQIREFCRKNNKVLFDFADIESYDPNGKINYMELRADDGCNYRQQGERKNWAAEWMQSHPELTALLPPSAAHTHPLNGYRKGSAFWWMLARLAGWNGVAASANSNR